MTHDELRRAKNHGAFLIDKIFADYVDQAFETTRFRRNGVRTCRDWLSAEILAELEATGDADAVSRIPTAKLGRGATLQI
jgi:hypothetical protein